MERCNHKQHILLIENQYTQFKHMAVMLRDERFVVFPKRRDYLDFMNNIRIYLNPRYGEEQQGSKRAAAFKRIVEYIGDNKPELFIVDQVLVGNHAGLDGLFLMQQLRLVFKMQPILFLSRTPANEERVMEVLPTIEPPNCWINKGYFGEEILDKDYFARQVIRRMNMYINNSFSEEIKTIIESLRTKYYDPMNKEILAKYRERLDSYLKSKYLSSPEANQLCIANSVSRPNEQTVATFMKNTERSEHDQ
jgi:hypothetical protein